jgi:2-methylfumaryl-CoA isomerase
MYDLLADMTVIEAASFIAGPSCGLHLAQMGARVIRIDTLGGGPDCNRWPQDDAGHSLYWQRLNKGKLSVTFDLGRPEGRELAQALVTAPGRGRGLFVTNFPAEGFLSHLGLAARRADLISLRVQGWADGRNGVDYTVNAAVGVPFLSGSEDLPPEDPVNSALPAWDLLAGAYGAFSLLAAERRRRTDGSGAEIRLALADLAMGSLAHLGQVAEAVLGGDRGRFGNALYGAFGRDFLTRDGQRLMIAAMTRRQWQGLLVALDITAPVAALEAELGISFARDEGLRFQHRHRLFPIVTAAVARCEMAMLSAALDKAGVCWERYRTLRDGIAEDPRLISGNPMFTPVVHPGGAAYATPGAMARLIHQQPEAPRAAPRLGEHTEMVLQEILGLSGSALGRLFDQGLAGRLTD